MWSAAASDARLPLNGHVGRWQIADLPEPSAAILKLRARQFGPGGAEDDHDPLFRHVLISSAADGVATCSFRYRTTDGAGALSGYTAGFYDLSPLARRFPLLTEVGRLCLTRPDPGLMRLVLACLTQVVTRSGSRCLFGCASLPGADPDRHGDIFRAMRATHALPGDWAPRALTHAPLPHRSGGGGIVPPMLGAYLSMGAGVGPDMVADRVLDTCHVLAALDVSRVPAPRARALIRLAGLIR